MYNTNSVAGLYKIIPGDEYKCSCTTKDQAILTVGTRSCRLDSIACSVLTSWSFWLVFVKWKNVESHVLSFHLSVEPLSQAF